jgi:PAS domain S-box-containing protein
VLTGIIKVANRLAQKLLGYKKTEMEGKNVSMLMPPPFSHRHNGYLRTHISSGELLCMLHPSV